jgi:hypothetical protein
MIALLYLKSAGNEQIRGNYFKNQPLCQCDADGVFISPSRVQALYIDSSSGRIMLFNTKTGATKPVTAKFVVLIKSVQWSEATNSAIIFLKTMAASKNLPPVH